MNNGLTAERMMDSFPLALQKDPKMVALAHSIANVLEQRLDEINLGQIYTRIDQLPEDLLDILAKDFAVDWYDHDYDLAAKRRTIKSAPYIHRHRGTAGAVLRGIRAIYPGSRLEEWWQYGGEPYHFRVMLDMSGSDASYVSTERVLWAIGYYKSLRSHNDGVYSRARSASRSWPAAATSCMRCGDAARSPKLPHRAASPLGTSSSLRTSSAAATLTPAPGSSTLACSRPRPHRAALPPRKSRF